MRRALLDLGRQYFRGAILLPLVCAACGGGGGSPPAANPSNTPLRLERVGPATQDFGIPVLLTAPPGDGARLFIVEKGGLVRIVNKATNIVTATFLDISGLVSTGSEQGLLGLAFDPLYGSNGRFYVNYTDTSGNSVIARYLRSAGNPDVANPAADRIVLTVAQPFANHNGGMVAFGPDNMLYAGFGDGGSAGDPGNRAQNPGELLGKMLRIDVSQGTAPAPAYAIPSDNPFASAASGREVWALGLRNPWRYSFDRQTGDLYIADVGQGNWEEVDVARASAGGGRGANYGWHVTEGNHCYPPGTSSCTTTGFVAPSLEYDHSDGACSITGGYVYRGRAIASLQGTYFYADYCAGFVRSFRVQNGAATQFFDWPTLRPGANITSFGEDGAGELYLMASSGAVYRIVSD